MQFIIKLLELKKRADSITARAKIANLQFDQFTAEGDIEKAEECRVAMLQLMEDNLDLRIEILTLTRQNEQTVSDKLRKGK